MQNKRPAIAISRTQFCLATACLIGIAYMPQLFLRFAFADDYAFLDFRGYWDFNPYQLGNGRPLGALIANFLFSVFDRVSDAAVLRLLALLELVAATVLLQRAALICGLETAWSALLAVGFATMPSIQNWVIWAISSYTLLALVCSVASFFCARRVIDEHGNFSIVNSTMFFGLFLSALLIYQPFATAVWPLMLLEALMQVKRPYLFRLLSAVSVAYFVTLLCYFATYKFVFVSFLPPDAHPRGGLLPVEAVFDKLIWFLKVPVFGAFSPTQTYPSGWIATATSGTILVGLWLQRESLKGFAKAVLLSIGALGMVHLPELVSADYPPIRTQVSISLVVIVLICMSLSVVARRIRLSGSVIRLSVFASCIALPVAASATILKINAWPQSLELALIERALENTRFPEGGPIVLIGAKNRTSLVGKYCDRIAMIGCASSSYHVLPSLVRLWMRDKGMDDGRFQFLYVRAPTATTAELFARDRNSFVAVPEDAFILDLGKVVKP